MVVAQQLEFVLLNGMVLMLVGKWLGVGWLHQVVVAQQPEFVLLNGMVMMLVGK